MSLETSRIQKKIAKWKVGTCKAYCWGVRREGANAGVIPASLYPTFARKFENHQVEEGAKHQTRPVLF